MTEHAHSSETAILEQGFGSREPRGCSVWSLGQTYAETSYESGATATSSTWNILSTLPHPRRAAWAPLSEPHGKSSERCRRQAQNTFVHL